ncbi:MAG: hypothetical protein KJ579_03855 [Verrucomicrobia bacterium]|nr:hypothetical protein [Verrucomicrobiota bacterium]
MAVYCPDCGNLLKIGAPAAGDKDCSRCTRPLGDPRHVEREAAAEKRFRVLFLDSVPHAIAAVLAGLILLTLAACLLFPVQTQQVLATLGISANGVVRVLGIPLQGFEWMMIGAGTAAILLFLRLPASQRAVGRM